MLIRVIRRLIYHRQDLTRSGIEQYRTAGFGRMVFHRSGETAISNILQAHIDTGSQVITRLGRLYLGDILDNRSPAVTNHASLSRLCS